VVTPFNERDATIAPDARWAAYTSNESGRDEVYVRAFPDAVGRWQVSTGGGQEPHWSRDGGTIFYRFSDTLFAVAVQTRPTFAVGRRSVVSVGTQLRNNNHANYDRHPRTGEFVLLEIGEASNTSLVVVLNWLEEFRRRMGAR
jgi:hypothetical protein